MTATPNKNLSEAAHNSLSWDTPVNTNFSQIDTAVAGIQTFVLTGLSGVIAVTSNIFLGSYPSSTASYIPAIFSTSGSASGNTTLQIPSGIGGQWIINNQGSGAFSLTVSSAGGGVSVSMSNGTIVQVWSDGTNVYVANSNSGSTPVGSVIFWPAASLLTNYMYCDGVAISRSTYSGLFAAVGTTWGSGDGSTTFNLPDFRGRVLAGADNMGGTAAGVLTGYNVGVSGGAQSITLTTAQLAVHTHTPIAHTHGYSDPGHVHGVSGVVLVVGSTIGFGSGFQYGSNTTSGADIGITIAAASAFVNNAGSGAAHSNIQPTSAVNVLIKYQ